MLRHRENKSKTKMRKGYTILRKNMAEVEAKVATIISFPPENPAPKMLIQDFKQQLGFVHSLVSAELAASRGAPSPPRHLRHIAARLDAIRSLFRDFSAGLPISSDAASSCSCSDSESCLDHDHDQDQDQEKEMDSGLDDGESEFEECLDAEIGGEEKGGLLSRVAVVFGVALIVVGFVIVVDFCLPGCVVYHDYGDYASNFLVPT